MNVEAYRTDLSSDGAVLTAYYRFAWPQSELEALMQDEPETYDGTEGEPV